MPDLLYFAYGSNMLRERLLARKVRLLDPGKPAAAKGFSLVFNKRSDDGSGKANLKPEATAEAWGVIFSVDPNSLQALDAAEGAPDHYRQETITVQAGSSELRAMTYLAQPAKLTTTPTEPYDWYLALILAGAKACPGLPPKWIKDVRQIAHPKPDPKQPLRRTFTEAVAQLKAAGFPNWRDLLKKEPDF